MPQVSRKRIVFASAEVNTFPVVPLPSPAEPAGTTSNGMYAQFFDLPFIPSWFRLRNDTPFAVALQFGSDAFRVPAYSIVADILETANPQRGAVLIQATPGAPAGLYDLTVQFSDVPGAAGAWSTNPSAGQAGVAPQVQVINFPGGFDALLQGTAASGAVVNLSARGAVLASPYSGDTTAVITTATTTQLAVGPAMMGTLVNTGAATSGAITVYDNTAASGTVLWTGTLTASQVLPLGLPCAVGLTVVTASAGSLLVSYSA